ncbi:MAG: hypothetical protein ACPGQS_00200 [Bradymonadia bacterium]
MNQEVLQEWFGYRWHSVMNGSGSFEAPVLPSQVDIIMGSGSFGSTIWETLHDALERLELERINWAPFEVLRFRLLVKGEWSADSHSAEPDLMISPGDLIAGLHRARQKIRRLEQRFDLLYGELPEGAYLASMKTRFRLEQGTGLDGATLFRFYETACKTLNRLLLARGTRLQSAVSSASRILSTLEELDEVVGLLSMDSASYLALDRHCSLARSGLTFDWVQQRINQRIAARTGRDWSTADAIKDELNSAGVILMDGDGVTDWWISYST